MNLYKEGYTLKFIENPGHGLTDPGAIGNSYKEKNITLPIAWLLGGILTHAGHEVDIQREGDSFIPLNQIGPMAIKAGGNRFISIHTDSSTDITAHGCTTYYFPGDSRSKVIAEKVVNSVSAKMGITNRGAREANFQVLRDTWQAMPSILIECAFISNPAEANMLANLTQEWKLANGIAGGLL